MPDFVSDVRAFHERFNQRYDGPPRRISPEEMEFRLKFLVEEVTETWGATMEDRPQDVLDGLVDLVYVAIGTAYLHGWDFNEAWRRVQAANMAKEPAPDGTFKIIKPPGWTPPDLRDLVV